MKRDRRSTVFWCNHDQPKAISRFGGDRRYWKESGKTLATVIHMFHGTPHVFQGEELRMTNPYFESISQYRDAESTNCYQILQEQGCIAKEALYIIQNHFRDNSRTPMQWSDSQYAGFSDTRPWIGVPENHTYIDVEDEEKNSGSTFHYYKRLIPLREKYGAIWGGDIESLHRSHPRILAYRRSDEENELMVQNSMGNMATALPEPFGL